MAKGKLEWKWIETWEKKGSKPFKVVKESEAKAKMDAEYQRGQVDGAVAGIEAVGKVAKTLDKAEKTKQPAQPAPNVPRDACPTCNGWCEVKKGGVFVKCETCGGKGFV